jgi:hypothetical protein
LDFLALLQHEHCRDNDCSNDHLNLPRWKYVN